MKKQPICFHTVPNLGAILSLEGQQYLLTGIKPHIRRDGTKTAILTWRSHCLVCNAAFDFTSGLSLMYPNRRCPQHHAPGRRVKASKTRGAR